MVPLWKNGNHKTMFEVERCDLTFIKHREIALFVCDVKE